MRFWGAQGLCGTGTHKLDWRLLGTLFVPGGNLPCSAHVWQGHPKSCRRGKVIQNSARKGQQMPALKLPPVAPLLAWGWPEQEADFSPPELQKPVQHVPQPSHPRVRVRKAAGIAKAGYPVPMLRRHLCTPALCPVNQHCLCSGC